MKKSKTRNFGFLLFCLQQYCDHTDQGRSGGGPVHSLPDLALRVSQCPDFMQSAGWGNGVHSLWSFLVNDGFFVPGGSDLEGSAGVEFTVPQIAVSLFAI